MTEGISFAPEGRFHNLLAEEMAGKEFAGKNIAVLSIGGQEGAGVTSTAYELSALLTREAGIKTKVVSFEEEKNKLYRQRTGRLTVDLNTEQELQASIDTDFYMVRQMLNPANFGSLVILDGRIAPFLAKEMELAEQDLLDQGRIDHPAPFSILSAYLFASQDARLSRKYLDAVRQDRTLGFEEFMEAFQAREKEEATAFKRTWPDLQGATPNNMNFQVRGQQVYNLRKDTTDLKEEEVAKWISNDPRFNQLLYEMVDISENIKPHYND